MNKQDVWLAADVGNFTEDADVVEWDCRRLLVVSQCISLKGFE